MTDGSQFRWRSVAPSWTGRHGIATPLAAWWLQSPLQSQQIERRRLSDARDRQTGMNLAAMMGLVFEEVGQGSAEGLL